MANINTTLTALNPQLMDVSDARAQWQTFRVQEGWAPRAPMLTPPSANTKFAKDASVVTVGLSLAQSTTSGVANLCPFSTPGCRAGCVATSGNGAFDSVSRARALKVKFLLAHPDAFITLVASEIDAYRARYGDQLRVRLNTFSDIRWEVVTPWLFKRFRDVRFYDYTKDWARTPPPNYTLVRSVSERSAHVSIERSVLARHNVAMVFDTPRGRPLPVSWFGLAVIDGDASDNRADDPRGVVVGLRAKGRMRRDVFGMVRPG